MHEPLSRHHQYPDQYQELDNPWEEPQDDYGWDDPDAYARRPWAAPRPYPPRQPLRNLREKAELELEQLLNPFLRPTLPRRTPGSRWPGLAQVSTPHDLSNRPDTRLHRIHYCFQKHLSGCLALGSCRMGFTGFDGGWRGV